MRPSARTLIGLSSVLCAVSCGSPTTEPDPDLDIPATLENIAGSYEVTHFVGGGFDVLALGGSLDLTLGRTTS